MIDYGKFDRLGRKVTLVPVGEDWPAVADVAPLDEQREFVPALAARYLFVNSRGGPWVSLGIYADSAVVGHIMWAVDDDGSHWIGGLMVDRSEQGNGVGRASVEVMMSWFVDQPDYQVTRLSYNPGNVAAARLYGSMGFKPNGEWVDDEVVVERVTRD